MKLYIKQKVFSWGDKFHIYDESGTERYYVEGEVFSLGKKLHVMDMSGRELVFIRRRLLAFLPKYEIEINGKYFATVKKHFTFVKQSYTVEELGWSVTGDFWAHNYEILDGSLPVATVRKEWLSWGDAYSIETAPFADALATLAIVLVIDAALDESDG